MRLTSRSILFCHPRPAAFVLPPEPKRLASLRPRRTWRAGPATPFFLRACSPRVKGDSDLELGSRAHGPSLVSALGLGRALSVLPFGPLFLARSLCLGRASLWTTHFAQGSRAVLGAAAAAADTAVACRTCGIFRGSSSRQQHFPRQQQIFLRACSPRVEGDSDLRLTPERQTPSGSRAGALRLTELCKRWGWDARRIFGFSVTLTTHFRIIIL